MPAALPAPIHRLRLAVSGAVAPLFGILAAFVLIPAVAIAIDIDRAITVRQELQDSVDAAALAVASLPSNSGTEAVSKRASDWFNANFQDKALQTSLTTSFGTKTVTLTASTRVPLLMGWIGGPGSDIPVSATAAAQWGLQGIELVMVLDNSGSMSDKVTVTNANGSTTKTTRIALLQQAASALVDAMSVSGVKIGVVPFSSSVNVGASAFSTSSGAIDQSLIKGVLPYGPDVFTTPQTDRFALFTQLGISWSGCVESRAMPYDILDDAPTGADPRSYFVPEFAPDEPSGYINDYLVDDVSGPWTAIQGSVTKYNKASIIQPMSRYSGPNYDCGTSAITRLSSDFSGIKTKINRMTSSSWTNIPMGLVWGWHVLSPNRPLADGAAYAAPNTLKVVVLVTDGHDEYDMGDNQSDNSTYQGIGYIWQNRLSTDSGDTSNPEAAMDDRLKHLCVNMKAKNIVIFTLPVAVTDPNIKSILSSCATDASKYIDVADPAMLTADFQKIAAQLSALRLSQ